MFASPFARVCFSVTADISLFCLLFVSEWDKKLEDLWASLGSKQCAQASCLPPPTIPPFFLLSPADLSILSSLLPRLLGRSLGRQCSRMDGWMRGWWVDRQETLVTHYDRGESHYMIRVAFFLRAPDMPITRLNPLSDDEGPLHVNVWGEKIPEGNGQTGALRVWKPIQLFKCMCAPLLSCSSRLCTKQLN